MKEHEFHSEEEDGRLSALVRESRPAPPLPARFQENVWRRIESGEDRAVGAASSWFDAFVFGVLRPRLAMACMAVLVLAGALLGAREGTDAARRHALAQYVSAVAPNPLH